MKKNPRKFSEVLLKMTGQKGTISILIAEIKSDDLHVCT